MAVNVFADDPRALLAAIKSAAADGTLETWTVDSDGDFTHSVEQWQKKAWMRPRVLEDRLVFNIITPVGTTLSRAVYGVYHGRFIEMLLNHFDLKFSRVTASALPTAGDIT